MAKLVFIEGTPAEITELTTKLGLEVKGAVAATPPAKPEAAPAPAATKPASAPKVTTLKAAPPPPPKAAPPKAPPKKPAAVEEEEDEEDPDAEEAEDEDEETTDEDAEDAEDDEEEPPAKKPKIAAKASKGAKTRANGSSGGVDPDAPELQNAKRLRDVLEYVIEQGHDDIEDIVGLCEGMKEAVPLLSRVHDIPARVRTAWGMMHDQEQASA